MQKKVKLMVGNRVVRVMEHQVADAIAHFGATKEKKEVKDVPKELLKIPEMKKVDPLPPMEVTRKKPVRSKSVK